MLLIGQGGKRAPHACPIWRGVHGLPVASRKSLTTTLQVAGAFGREGGRGPSPGASVAVNRKTTFMDNLMGPSVGGRKLLGIGYSCGIAASQAGSVVLTRLRDCCLRGCRIIVWVGFFKMFLSQPTAFGIGLAAAVAVRVSDHEGAPRALPPSGLHWSGWNRRWWVKDWLWWGIGRRSSGRSGGRTGSRRSVIALGDCCSEDFRPDGRKWHA